MLIVDKNPNSISGESYKSLRTSIKYASVDEELKTIVITSSVPEEGKTTVAGNLALSLSEFGSSVLLIDCDLRRPKLHEKFNLENKVGLTDLLINDYGLEKVVNVINDNLNFISSGKTLPYAAELLGSKKMEDFLGESEQNYDYIILDTPPLMSVTDPQILAAKAQGTIMVVRANKTKGRIIKKAYKELEKVNAKVIGTVLNGSERIEKHKY